MKKRLLIAIFLVVVTGMLTSGCSNKELLQQKDAQIVALQDELGQLEDQLRLEREQTARLQGDLDNALSDHRAKEQVWRDEKDNLTRITLDGEVTFATGSTQLTDTGKEILNKVFEIVERYPGREISIEGHTDNVPIAGTWQHRFQSNWELSSARAHKVLHYVRSKYGISPERIAAVGYGEYRPIGDNNTDAGRAANRRVVITVGPGTSSVKTLP